MSIGGSGRQNARGGMMAWPGFRHLRDSKEDFARHNELTSRRLSALRAPSKGLEDADPDEVEARIRNLSHGTGTSRE